ncbi:hypothetical protein Ms3S1_16180 [Methylosinus sp. 3S-1]
MRAIFESPLETAKNHVGFARSVIAENLAYERLFDATRDTDSQSIDVSTKNSPGAMASMSLAITITKSREIHFHEVYAVKGRMSFIDARIQNANDDAFSRT